MHFKAILISFSLYCIIHSLALPFIYMQSVTEILKHFKQLHRIWLLYLQFGMATKEEKKNGHQVWTEILGKKPNLNSTHSAAHGLQTQTLLTKAGLHLLKDTMRTCLSAPPPTLSFFPARCSAQTAEWELKRSGLSQMSFAKYYKSWLVVYAC